MNPPPSRVRYLRLPFACRRSPCRRRCCRRVDNRAPAAGGQPGSRVHLQQRAIIRAERKRRRRHRLKIAAIDGSLLVRCEPAAEVGRTAIGDRRRRRRRAAVCTFARRDERCRARQSLPAIVSSHNNYNCKADDATADGCTHHTDVVDPGWL